MKAPWIALASACLAVVISAPASAMTVNEFLATVDRLKAKGIGALWAPERKQLQTAVETVSRTYRARLDTQRKAGQRPESCPPPKGKLGIDGKQLISELRALPPQDRQGELLNASEF